jgi:DNA-binding transcriptional ArsR family regulator
MVKVTLDKNTFKALASETRLNILKTLDGKKLGLNEISKATKLNKATLHEHLLKLNEAGLVKRKEREGHKWVYYKLTWKGESLLHPENTRIVVLFTITFIILWSSIIQFLNYYKKSIRDIVNNGFFSNDMNSRESKILTDEGASETTDIIYNTAENGLSTINQNPILLNIAIIFFIIAIVILFVSIWRYKDNKKSRI